VPSTDPSRRRSDRLRVSASHHLGHAWRLSVQAWGIGWLRLAVSSLIGLAALAAVARSVPVDQVLQHAWPSQPGSLPAIGGLMLFSQLARALRWRLLLRGWGQVRLLDALWLNAATQLLNYAVPVRAGEGLRLWWLSSRMKMPVATRLGLIVVDHAFDLAGVTAVLGLGAILKASAADPHLPALPLLLVVLGLAAATLTAISGGLWLGPRLGLWRPARRLMRRSWVVHLASHRRAFRGGLAPLRGPRMAAMVAVSAIAVVADGLAFAMLFWGLGLQVPFLSAVVTKVTLLYTSVLPAAPGYVGSMEAAGTLLLVSVGLSRPAAVGAMVVWHALATVVIVLLGVVALHRVRGTAGSGGGWRLLLARLTPTRSELPS
jgi:uncharacterized protein (TIRG00374 family)